MSDVSSTRAPKGAVRPSRYLVALAGLALLVLLSLPFAVNDYLLYVVNLTLVYALAAVGFNIVLGYLGQLAFANAAFFGIGAYAFAVSISVWHLPFLAALAFAAAVGGATGFVVGLPALRLRRYYLAIVTLVFGELLRWLYIHSDGITGGSGGLGLPPVSLAGLAIDTDSRKFYVLLAVAGVMIWLTWNILSSRIGRAWTAVRENELAAASLGLSPARYKIAAFAWSGVVSGVAGALFALLLGRISPESFNLHQLLMQFAIVMIGGLGSVLGAILGAVLLTAAPELLRNVPGIEEIVFSLLLIGVLLYMPRGLSGMLAARFPALREPLYRK